ncbi:relaxase/mobilization nuclease domain-containing protein [Rhodopirellula bahusiensis]|uniref:relaxase/mobilization nuclease domain-containing protein n=1 Tax=Rhodopirellula bahusiensis TaxID=2014065 RepID=UPI0032673E98
MVPKIHAKGSGFGGITQYVLHDKDAETSERVEWTETVNLGTKNPETASRVMMATSMDQDRLKKEAGVKATGRKSKDHVLHVTLSWHADEREGLSKEEQIKAAKWFMREIKASDRQALIVSHKDEPQPHIHLVINRVSPKDGKILPSSFERLNASKWAEKYERERGKILCHNRVINNAARKRGEYVRGEKDLPRPLYEQTATVANDNTKKTALLSEQRKKAAAIAKEQRETKTRHRKEWQQMEATAKTERRELQQQTKSDAAKAAQRVRDSYREKWAHHHHEQETAQAKFDANEKTLRGRIENARKLVAWRDVLRRKTETQRATTIGATFRVLASEGARREALSRQYKMKEATLNRQQKAAEKAAAEQIKSQLSEKQVDQRRAYEQKRNATIMKHRLETAKVKTRWKAHEAKQRQDWGDLQKQDSRLATLRATSQRAASSASRQPPGRTASGRKKRGR